MSYTRSKCSSASNTTIKKVQKMLKKLKLYNSEVDGYFGPKTEAAVKAFQKKNKLTVDGFIGPETLQKLAEKTNTKYFIIKYKKDGGTGTLNNSYNDTQVVLTGIKTRLSSSKLYKSGYVHVGWYNKYNKLFYSLGANIAGKTANKKTFTFKAIYCPDNKPVYDKKKGKCKASSTSSSIDSSTSLYTRTGAKMTYYTAGAGKKNGHCWVYFNADGTYTDKQYGNVRMVASNYLKNNYGCGTIVKITATSGNILLQGNVKSNTVYAAVVDSGGTDGLRNESVLDFFFPTGTAPSEWDNPTITYQVVRKGYAK